MLIKIDLVLMCYGGIKRWNGFLHCSLGKCNTVFLWSESVWMSLSQTECIKYSKYLWAQLWSSPLLSSLFCLLYCWPPFILIGNSLIEINCYISDQSSCQKTRKFQLYLTEMCIVSCIQILVKTFSLIIHEMISYIHKDSTSFDFVLKYRMTDLFFNEQY